MAILPIYNCYHSIMKKKAEPYTNIDDSVRLLSENMFETMYKADGVGLAANQVGIDKQIVVIDTSAGQEDKPKNENTKITMINPVIEEYSEEFIDYQEGCLSVPSLHEKVIRPITIKLKYFDLDMHEHNIETDGLLARVAQHEIDHLNGVLFYERLTPMRRALARSKLRNIQRGRIVLDYAMILPDGSLLE